MLKKMLLAAIIGMFFISASSYAQDNQDLSKTLKIVVGQISSSISSMDKNLKSVSERIRNINPYSNISRKVLNDLAASDKSIIDCAIINPQGVMIVVEPKEYNRYEGTDISTQEHIKRMLKNHEPVLSKVFTSVEGIKSVDAGYPMFSDYKEFTGSVSVLFKPEIFLGEAAKLPEGISNIRVWVMQKDGVIVYDPDVRQINSNVFISHVFTDFPSLIEFSRKACAEKSGTGAYDFHKTDLADKNIVKKEAVWDTVNFYGAEWRVIVARE